MHASGEVSSSGRAAEDSDLIWHGSHSQSSQTFQDTRETYIHIFIQHTYMEHSDIPIHTYIHTVGRRERESSSSNTASEEDSSE